jgi:ABC-2 type transport system permease protein
MFMRRATAILLRQFYLLRGSPARIIPLFAWVVVDVVLWGFITRYLSSITSAGLSIVASLLGTVLLWNFLTRVMQGVTMTFVEDVWSRNFLNLFASPLSVPEYLCGLVLASIATSTIGLLMMVLVASVAFGVHLWSFGLLVVPFLAVLFLFGISLGILGTAVVLRLGPAAEWLIWPVPALVSPFACVFYPRATLPHWMRLVSHALPPSYVFEGMRALVAEGTVSSAGLVLSLGLAGLYVVLACGVFTRVYQQAVRTGSIARYSAESVS